MRQIGRSMLTVLLATLMAGGPMACGQDVEQQNITAMAAGDGRHLDLEQALAPAIFISPNSARGTCLAVAGGQRRDGAQVVLERCDARDVAQAWRFDGAALTIFGDKCLDVTSGRDEDGVHLQIWTCARGNANQRWKWQDQALKWQGHTRCLDLPAGNAQPGTALQLWSCGRGNLNQQWRFSGPPSSPPEAPSSSKTPTASAPPAPTEVAHPPCKRGMAIGNEVHPALSAKDLAAVSPGVAWWYNYSPKALSEEVAEASRKTGVAFVPMLFNAGSTSASSVAQVDGSSGYLLAFNEPNFFAQANMTPEQAAQAWPAVEQVARRYNLKIVGPAMNYCGGGCNQTDPFAWLDRFFAACQGCQVDYLAVHAYVCYPAALTEAYLTPFGRYNKKLWVTEFACLDGSASAASLAVQKEYMKQSVALMEANANVFRYAWFIGRSNSASPPIGLLDGDGQLTELGRWYVSLPRSCDSHE